MFPWNMLGKNNQFNEWMKRINDSGMEQQLDKIFSRFANQNGASPPEENQGTTKNNVVIFETAEFVFVKIELSEKEIPSSLRIAYSFNKLYVEGMPAHEEKQTFLLPAVVKKKDAQIYFQDSTLEIKIPKYIDQHLVEVDLTAKHF